MQPAKTPELAYTASIAEDGTRRAVTDVREKLAAQGAMVVGGTRQDFKHYLQSEGEWWGTVFRTLKISL